MGTRTISPPWSATIIPNAPSCTASTAATPKRVARTRSKADGVPPRWMWPRMVTRASKPVRRSISSASQAPIPPRRAWPNWSTRCPRAWPRRADSASGPSAGTAPSATTTIDENWPPRCRRCSRSHTASTSKGTSGTRISAAPPAIPAWVAIQPTWRPMTSHTMTRWWDSAVVRRRSMASVAICTAVSNPKVTSVPDRSLSMVLGMPTASHAVVPEAVGHAEGVLAPHRHQRVDTSCAPDWRRTRSGPPSTLKGLVRDVPEDGPARAPGCRGTGGRREARARRRARPSTRRGTRRPRRRGGARR